MADVSTPCILPSSEACRSKLGGGQSIKYTEEDKGHSSAEH